MSNPLVGSTILIRVTVTDPDTGDPTAAAVALVIQAPDGTETTEIPANPELGTYEFFLDLTEDGWWTAIWTVTVGGFTTVKECAVCAGASALVGSSP